MATTEERLAALEAKLAQLTDTTPTAYYTHQYSGEEIDAAVGRALPNGAIDQAAGTFVRPNLLDNWYFGRPVNQRGQMSYTGSVYGIDRWVGNRDQTITIADNYLNIVKGNDIASGFSQFLPREAIPTGATVTLSFLFAPGTQNCVFGLRETNKWSWFAQAVVQTDETNYQLVSVTIPDVTLSTGNFAVLLSFETENPGSVIRPIAAKLELGSTQTLAHLEGDKWVLNEVPDYGEQLRRCQRYAIDLNPNRQNVPIIGTVNVDGTTMWLSMQIPTSLRTTPVISNLRGTVIVSNDSGSSEIAFGNDVRVSSGMITIAMTGSQKRDGFAYMLDSGGAGIPTALLSADL